MYRYLAMFTLIVMNFTFASCVTSGNPTAAREDLISQIKIGETTKEDARRMFGQPTVMSRHSGAMFPGLPGSPNPNSNVEVWNYTHMNTEVDPVTFIPVIGMFAGSATSKMSQLTVTFDEQGIVRHIQTGQTQATAGPGASTSP